MELRIDLLLTRRLMYSESNRKLDHGLREDLSEPKDLEPEAGRQTQTVWATEVGYLAECCCGHCTLLSRSFTS